MSYLSFVFYLLLMGYSVGVYFPIFNNASSASEILLWYVLPLLGVFLFSFLTLFFMKKWKSPNVLHRRIQLILFTVFNCFQVVLYTLASMSLPNIVRMHILCALYWLLAPVIEYFAVKNYREIIQQDEKPSWVTPTTGVLIAIGNLAILAVLIFNKLNITRTDVVPDATYLYFDIPMIVVSLLCLLTGFVLCFKFHCSKLDIDYLGCLLVISDASMLFGFVESLFFIGGLSSNMCVIATGLALLTGLVLTIIWIVVERKKRGENKAAVGNS